MQRILLTLFIVSVTCGVGDAQFRALRSLPWYPKGELTASQIPTGTATGNVLEDLNSAYTSGNYRDVVFKYYPQAIKEGYQRNGSLYNNTRRALRQLMHEDPSATNWKQMQTVYRDRMKYIGTEDYDYRNNLETTSWSEEQMQNEYIAALASIDNRYQDCYRESLRRVEKVSGRIDLAVVLQGMFAPLNRAHAANPDLGKSLNERYQEILNYIERSEDYMEREHHEDYMTYYPSTIIDQVRGECLRVIHYNNATAQATAQREAHEHQEAANAAYAEALNYYRQKNYTSAYNACNEGFNKYGTPEFRILKSTILQNCANEATSSADRVAFLCAAYTAGQGYVSRQTQSHIIRGLQANLFMSGIAGKTHRTSKGLVITQQVWTLDELKQKTN